MANSWSFLYDEMNYKINDFDVDIPPTDTATNIFEYTYDEHGPRRCSGGPMVFRERSSYLFLEFPIYPILPE